MTAARAEQTKRLLAAIQVDDREAFADAVHHDADINTNDGEPLWLAASLQRHDLAIELFKLNANVHIAFRHAATRTSEAQNAYTKAEKYAKDLMLHNYSYSSRTSYSHYCTAEKIAHDKMREVEVRLSNYYKGYQDITSAQKADKMDLLIREIRDMREILEALDKEIIRPERLYKSKPPSLK